MDKLPPDIIAQLALDMNITDVFNWCLLNSRFNSSVCKKEIFWMNRLIKDYPKYKDFLPEETHKERYRILHELNNIWK